HLIEEPDQGVHERLRGARAGDERPLALDPLDHALVLQLGQRLTHHGPRDAVLLAQPVLARQGIARLQSVLLDVVDDQFPQLVVHGRRGAPVDSLGHGAHQYATPACRITFAYGVNSPERTKARAAWVRCLNSTCGTSSISMPGSRSRSASRMCGLTLATSADTVAPSTTSSASTVSSTSRNAGAPGR